MSFTYVSAVSLLTIAFICTEQTTPQKSNVTTHNRPRRDVPVSLNLHRKALQEYFLPPDELTEFGSLLAVIRPFASPYFESRLETNLDPATLKNIFQELVHTTIGDENIDSNLTNTNRIYANVIEDLVALILVANCGVSIPDQDKKHTQDLLAKNILTFEKARMRKGYLEKLMATIPESDIAIYRNDYFGKYKYNPGIEHPLPFHDYMSMRHRKKLQYYLCNCQLSWSFVFTGDPAQPVDMEETTVLPEFRVTTLPPSIMFSVSQLPFQDACKYRLPRSHLSATIPRGFQCNQVIEARPIRVTGAPVPAASLPAASAPAAPQPSASVPPPAAVPQAAPVAAPVAAPAMVPGEQNAVRFASWRAHNKNDYETNKNEGVTKFSAFPTAPLQLSSDKTRHI